MYIVTDTIHAVCRTTGLHVPWHGSTKGEACIGLGEIKIQRFRVQRFQIKGVERVLLNVWSSIHIKLIDSPLYHIKGKSVMKACWVELPCNGWENIQVIA